MTKGTAEHYWAATAEGHFEAMSSQYEPGERVDADAVLKRPRHSLPPLTASQTILDAIAACAQPREGGEPAAPAQTEAVAQQAAVAVPAE